MEISKQSDIQISTNSIIKGTPLVLKDATQKDLNRELNDIFRKGSTTYFNSSRFFPSRFRKDVSELYAFVRIADNFVDSVPQDAENFYRFIREFHSCLKSGESLNSIVRGFVSLMERKDIPADQVRSFLRSMEMDLYKSVYKTLDEVLEYIYGSAEVIGLMMQKILELDDSASYYASMLGRSMQFLNFIRDVKEDNSLGRIYLPADEMREFGIDDLKEETARSNPEAFSKFMRYQLDRFFSWDRKARKGFTCIPSILLIPIKTAEDMYLWTGRKIYRNPLIVFDQKVKPTRRRIVSKVFLNTIGIPLWQF